MKIPLNRCNVLIGMKEFSICCVEGAPAYDTVNNYNYVKLHTVKTLHIQQPTSKLINQSIFCGVDKSCTCVVHSF